jgi:hypothetical protein
MTAAAIQMRLFGQDASGYRLRRCPVADPFCTRRKGRRYLVGTQCAGIETAASACSSADLHTWNLGPVLVRPDCGGERSQHWAPKLSSARAGLPLHSGFLWCFGEAVVRVATADRVADRAWIREEAGCRSFIDGHRTGRPRGNICLLRQRGQPACGSALGGSFLSREAGKQAAQES